MIEEVISANADSDEVEGFIGSSDAVAHHILAG